MCVCVCERVFECLCVRLLFKPQKRSQRVRRRRCLSRCHRHRRRQCGTGNDDAADKSNNNSNDDDGVGLPVRKVGHIFFLPYRRLPKGHTHTTCAHIQRDRGKRTLIARVYKRERDSHVRFVSLARGEVKPS